MNGSWPRTLRLDAILLGELFEIEPVALGAVVHTPTRRDFHFGNAIHLHGPPDDLAPVLALWREHLASVPEVARFVTVWEGAVDDELPPDVTRAIGRHGLELDRSDIMRLGVLRPAERSAQLTPRAAASDTDWACVGALLRWISDEAAPEFWRWMGATGFRTAAETGRATAWLVHRHAEPACTVVIGRDGRGSAYIGAVATHPSHRGQGLASALTHHACEVHRFRYPDDRIELGVDPGGQAQRIYERLGFGTVSGWWELTGDADAVRASTTADPEGSAG